MKIQKAIETLAHLTEEQEKSEEKKELYNKIINELEKEGIRNVKNVINRVVQALKSIQDTRQAKTIKEIDDEMISVASNAVTDTPLGVLIRWIGEDAERHDLLINEAIEKYNIESIRGTWKAAQALEISRATRAVIRALQK